MIRALRHRIRPRALGVDALFLALGVAAAALGAAWRTAPLPTPAASSEPVRPASASAGALASSSHPVDATVAAAPFRPDRTRPPVRYRIVAPATPQSGVANAIRSFVPPVRLQGVVVHPRGGMAALSVHGRPPQLVRKGQMFEGLRLVRVQAHAATLVGPDTTLVLQLPGAARH